MEIEIHIDVYSWQLITAVVMIAAIRAAAVIVKIIKGAKHDSN